MKEVYGICPNKLKLYLYWTGERDKDNAIMHIPFNKIDLKSDERYFDTNASKIQEKDFDITKTPDPSICNKCGFSSRYCAARGIIKPER